MAESAVHFRLMALIDRWRRKGVTVEAVILDGNLAERGHPSHEESVTDDGGMDQSRENEDETLSKTLWKSEIIVLIS